MFEDSSLGRPLAWNIVQAIVLFELLCNLSIMFYHLSHIAGLVSGQLLRQFWLCKFLELWFIAKIGALKTRLR